MPAFGCPVRGCTTVRSRRACLLHHIRTVHSDKTLTGDQLRDIQAKYCTKCGVLKSTSGNGHKCQPGARTGAAPAAEAGAGPAAPEQLPPPPATASQLLAQLIDEHAAPPEVDQPGQYACRAPQTVPFAARDQWKASVTRLLEDVLSAINSESDENIVSALRALLLLPSQALADSGASRGRARRVRARLSRLDSGEALTQAHTAGDRQPGAAKKQHELQKLASRVHKQLSQGSVTRAAKCLEALPIAPATAESAEALRKLHPRAPPPQRPAATAAPAQITADTLQQVLKSLPKGSAPGPSGWTYEHIQAATTAPDSAVDPTLRLINTILSGKLPHLPDLLDSALIGLEKPGGNGLRPIAIGETWLRLASRCAIAACPDVGKALAALQLAVGISGGSEIVGHALNTALEAEPDSVVVQVDWSNTISRQAMLEAIAERAPSLLPYAWWVYRQAGRLLFDGLPEGAEPIMSECGVRQGDPISVLYFAVACQGKLEKLCELHPSVRVIAFADDTSLQGAAEDVVAAFPTLCELGKEVGLEVKIPKCGVYSANAQAAAETAAALGVQNHAESGGFVAAGTPIGTDAFVTAHAEAKADGACALIASMLELPLAAQDKFVLLKSSLQLRVAHLPRCARWELISGAIQRAEGKAAEAAFAIMQHPVQEDVRDGQLTLPLRFGGMGIRATTQLEGEAALLSSAAMAQATLLKGAPEFRPLDGPRAATFEQTWQQVRDAGAGTELFPAEAEASDDARLSAQSRAQHNYARLVAERRAAALFEAYDQDSPDGQGNLARLRSCACRAASIWIDVLPVCAAFTLNDPKFKGAMRHRLGLSHMPANARGVQCSCGHYIQPGDVHHAMSCKKLSGARTLRHEILKRVWRRLGNRAGVATSEEPSTRALQAPGDGTNANKPESRGDILFALNSALTVGDVAVVHPSAQTYRRAAAKEDGAAAAATDKRKRDRYETVDPHGYAFEPLSVESYGRMGKPAMKLLNTLAAAANGGSEEFKQGFITNALRELSVALCKGNAVIHRRGLYVLATASGTNFIPEMDVPTVDVP